MKDYFKRENVLAVLGLIFAGLIFCGTKFYDTQNDIFKEYAQALENKTALNETIKNSYEVLKFANDSMKGTSSRISEYGTFLKDARNFPNQSNIQKAFELKRAVLNDIAVFSKFDNIKVSDDFPDIYVIHMEYLEGEKKLVNLMYQFSVMREAKKFNNVELYAEMESALLDLESTNKKILTKSWDVQTKISQQKIIDKQQSENFQNGMAQKKSIVEKCLYATAVLLFLWLSVFILAIKYGTFKQ